MISPFNMYCTLFIDYVEQHTSITNVYFECHSQCYSYKGNKSAKFHNSQ